LLTPNITPDPDTGIGNMSDDEFVASLRDGIGRDGRHLYPAMPFPYYTRLSREDILSIRAFLNTLKPVHHAVVADQLPFPFDIRAVMLVWDKLNFKKGPFQPDPSKPADWNRGAFLVEGPGHCGACHTPKTSLGGDKNDQYLQGGVLGGWLSPNLTSNRRIGLGSWSDDDIVSYLQTGHNRQTGATGPMAEVIADSTSRMTDGDVRAIAVYLRSLPAAPAEPSAPAAAPNNGLGQAVYADNCAACHGLDGNGQAGMFPSLKGDAVLQSPDPDNILQLILNGGTSVSTVKAPTGPGMPAFGWKLSDEQVAAVANFARSSWGNAAASVTADAVHSHRENGN
jgi:mono/diheme cytochrome c family protein